MSTRRSKDSPTVLCFHNSHTLMWAQGNLFYFLKVVVVSLRFVKLLQSNLTSPKTWMKVCCLKTPNDRLSQRSTTFRGCPSPRSSVSTICKHTNQRRLAPLLTVLRRQVTSLVLRHQVILFKCQQSPPPPLIVAQSAGSLVIMT